MKLGIYIGSFNPPHKGHINVVNYLLRKQIIDKILIVPTKEYWNKQNLAPLQDRINMLKFFETEDIIIDAEHNEYEYTYELMRVLKEKHPDSELHLIIGADNIINFHKWKNYEELLQYKIIIMNRGNIDIDKYIINYPNANFIVLKDFKNLDISSTEIRNNLNDRYLNKKVLQYIKKNKLYRR